MSRTAVCLLLAVAGCQSQADTPAEPVMLSLQDALAACEHGDLPGVSVARVSGDVHYEVAIESADDSRGAEYLDLLVEFARELKHLDGRLVLVVDGTPGMYIDGLGVQVLATSEHSAALRLLPNLFVLPNGKALTDSNPEVDTQDIVLGMFPKLRTQGSRARLDAIRRQNAEILRQAEQQQP